MTASPLKEAHHNTGLRAAPAGVRFGTPVEAVRVFLGWGLRLQLSLEGCEVWLGEGTIQGILPRGWGADLGELTLGSCRKQCA